MVRWQSGRRSSNVEDRRSMGGRGIALGGGGMGLVFVIIYLLMGGNPLALLQQVAVQQQQRPAGPASPEEEEQFEFARTILADTEDVWTSLFEQMGREYRPTTMVVYRGRVNSGCGSASSAAGPFYCPADEKVYLDLSFYEELERRFGAPGDFARAYVIAHEVGHHVQNLLGTSEKVQRLQARASEVEANELSVRLELQADFLAGVWAHHAQKQRNILEPGDIEEGLNAASAIGDDALQKRSQGYVVKDSFTHGSSAQRVRWFRKGFETGDINQGDTFNTNRL